MNTNFNPYTDVDPYKAHSLLIDIMNGNRSQSRKSIREMAKLLHTTPESVKQDINKLREMLDHKNDNIK